MSYAQFHGAFFTLFEPFIKRITRIFFKKKCAPLKPFTIDSVINVFKIM